MATAPIYLASELGHREILSVPGGAASLRAERLLAACLDVDEPTVRALIAEHPDIVRKLPPEQMRTISDAAWSHKTEAGPTDASSRLRHRGARSRGHSFRPESRRRARAMRT